jgi:hypothetical protein
MGADGQADGRKEDRGDEVKSRFFEILRTRLRTTIITAQQLRFCRIDGQRKERKCRRGDGKETEEIP